MIGVVCPSYGDECGVAEYTKSLFDCLPQSLVVRAGTEDFYNVVDTVIVQHENSLWTDDDLHSTVVAAKNQNCRVHLTVHTVESASRPWDTIADTYTALTQQGKTILEGRGCRNVAYLPIGCSVPQEPRTRQGLVVGAFGFFEEHKQYFAIADAVRGIHQASMRLYAYNRTANTLYTEFEAMAVGKPITVNRSFLPHEELLQELHAQCDLLVFWYQEVDHASASAAVRVGLASGVPVVTTATNWFRDLGEAVYRPAQLQTGLERLLTDSALYDHYQAAGREYCLAHSWDRVATEYMQRINKLAVE